MSPNWAPGRLGRLLSAEPPLWLALLIGLAAGLLACGYFAGYGSLLAIIRDPAPAQDQAQAISGAIAFLRDDWRFPLFEVANWVEDRRVNVLFTDSIPIYLLVWKLIGLGPEAATHYYAPSWFILTFAFQGVAAALALRLLGLRGGLTLLAGALVFCSMPLFLFRFGHLALATHGVLLIAIALALLRFPGEARGAVLRLAAWALLMALSLLLHPYLLAMVAGLWALSILSLFALAREDGLPLPPIALALGIGGTIALLLAIMIVSGHLTGGGSAAPGFGRFSANLATFFMPGELSAFFDTETELPQGQHEGFAYMPLAAFLLIAGAAALRLRHPLPGSLARDSILGTGRGIAILTLAAVFLALFATGGRFAWFEHELFAIDFPSPIRALGEVFRSSGRFVWLIAYPAVLIAIAIIALTLPRPAATLTLTAAAVLTMIELIPVRDQMPRPSGDYTTDQRLQTLAERMERFAIHPVKPCGRDRSYADGELQYLTARHDLVLANSFFSARDVVDCADPATRALPGPPRPGTAAFILTPVTPAALEESGLSPEQCRQRPGLIVCLHDWSAEPDLAKAFAPLAMPRLQTPTSLNFTRGADAENWLGQGFSDPEAWGVWSIGPRSTLFLPLTKTAPTAAKVILRARPFLYPSAGTVPVTLTLQARRGPDAPWQTQDRATPVWSENDGERETVLNNALPRATSLRIVIEPARPRSPKDAGVAEDTRLLGLALSAVRLEASKP
ncbi:MAG: DUF6311 domain-containing protein [Pseudomonadota bacterium]